MEQRNSHRVHRLLLRSTRSHSRLQHLPPVCNSHRPCILSPPHSSRHRRLLPVRSNHRPCILSQKHSNRHLCHFRQHSSYLHQHSQVQASQEPGSRMRPLHAGPRVRSNRDSYFIKFL